MIKRAICSGTTLALLLSGGGRESFANQLPEKPAKLGSNEFDFKLFSASAKKNENTVISPLSAYLALSMTCAGAAGPTAEAMTQALCLSKSESANLKQHNKELIDSLNKTNAVEIANALFADSSAPFRPSFISLSEKFYEAKVENLPFQSSGSLKKINEWVSTRTHGKIPSILSNLRRDDKLVLLNATYFKGSWVSKFDKKSTNDCPFYLLTGEKATVPVMHKTGNLAYVRQGNFQVVSLPYAGNKLAMCIILPDKAVNFQAFVKGLKADTFITAMRGMHDKQVNLALPKFKVSSRIQMRDALCSIGMGKIFDLEEANFSNLTAKPVCIGRVVQNTYIDVNEEGTEAAAATAVVAMAKDMYSEVVDFTVDRPFVIAIRDESSGQILFLGAIIQPQSV